MRNYLTLFISLFAITCCYPQQYNFHNYSVKEGVAQSQVYSLHQDHRGYLWMGTRGGGITQFDGVNFKTFTVKDGLVNNYISCIREDKHHNLWIGTIDGLSSYNGQKFKNFKPAGDSTQITVHDIDFDSRNRKWLGTNVGLLVLDEKGLTNVTEILKEKKSVINAVHVDKQNTIWFGGSNEGLYKLKENKGKFEVIRFDKNNGFTNNSIPCIKEDRKGNLWIGTYGDGVYVYNGSRFYRVDLHLELYKQTILDIYFDESDNVWLATLNNGVAQYNRATAAFSWITEKEGLSNNHVRSIIQDHSGNYWFGTSGGGVCNYFGKQFTVYDKSSGLGGNFIYSIYRDSKNRLWSGTSDKGITLYDSARFFNYNSLNGFADVKVKAIAEDNSGNIYFGTDGQGVYVFNGSEFRELTELSKKYIRAIKKTNEGDLWIATAGAGLYKLVLASSPWLINYTVKDKLKSNRITSLHYDKQGRLWYGTESDGIGLIVNDKVQKLTFTTKEGLPSNAIRCMMEDLNGFLWAGTAGDGIFSMPLYQGDFKIKRYDHTNGLTSSNIYLLTCDASNSIFAGSETGLDHLSFDKERKLTEVKHYGKGEGFTGIETCQNSVSNDKDGTIWFGTINGLTRYNPENLFKNKNEPVTSITDIQLFYEPIANTVYKNLIGDWNTVSNLNLPHDQNHLTFVFTGINFSNPDAVKYKWKLEGFDEDWSPVSKDRKILYSNLSPGNYTFMVKASNEDGVWNKNPVVFKFSIAAPFWKKWWFILIMAGLIFAGVLLVFKWRVNRIKRKASETQQKIQLEKEIIELEQKALRLQMNPHFIFNALNSIQSQIGTDNEQTARYYLAKFSRLMRQILDNSRNPVITLEEEVNTLENYLLIEKFCNGDRFDYKISVDPSIEKDYVKIPPMILQPFIENSIKHGLKYVEGKKGMIEVSFKEVEQTLECSVTDNGIGREKSEELNKRSKETYHKSTALLITQERLDLLKDNIHSKSLEIIDLYDENNEACGTRVIVRIPLT